MNKTLTILIPSYNTSKFIDECLPHFIDARLENDLDVFLIDDGSKDNTLDKLKEYESKYPNIFKVFHKENGGHGSVINYGVQHCETKYFKVVDGDDYPDTEALIKFIAFLKTQDADIVINPYTILDLTDGSTKVIDFAKKLDNRIELTGEEFISIHGLTYKVSLWRDNNVRVDEHIFYEDVEYDLFPLPFAKTSVVYPDPVIIYRMGVNGQSVSKEGVKKHYKDHETMTASLLKYWTLNKDVFQNEAFKSYYQLHCGRVLVPTLGRMVHYDTSLSGKDIRRWEKEIKSTSKEIYRVFKFYLEGKIRFYRALGYPLLKTARKLKQ